MKRFLCLGLIFGMVLWSGSAWALSMAETTSVLLWDTLSISSTEVSVPLGTFQYTNLAATAGSSAGGMLEADPDPTFDSWDTPQVAEAPLLPFAEGYAESYPDILIVSASAAADGTTNTWAEASGDLHRSGGFTLDLDMELTFSIDYYLDSYIEFDNGEVEDASIYNSLIEISFTKDGGVLDDFHLVATDFGEGSLMLTALFEAGSYGIDAHMYSSVFASSILNDIGSGGAAPVPEPSTMVLMGLGLVGLAGYGRKRLKH